MTTKIHNKSLGTDSLSEARIRRDAILLQLTKARQQNESPQYSALIEKYQGASREELKEKLEDQGELLSEDFNYIGHQEYKGGLEEPTQSEILEYESLQVLSGNKNKNIIKDKHRLRLSQAYAALMQEKVDLPRKTKNNYTRSMKIFLAYLNRDDVLMYVIDRFMIRKFVTTIKRTYEPSTIRTIISNLGVIWGYARDAERFSFENPFTKQGVPSRDQDYKFYEDWNID